MIRLIKSRSMLPYLQNQQHTRNSQAFRNMRTLPLFPVIYSTWLNFAPNLTSSPCRTRTSSHLSQKSRALSVSQRMLLLCYIFAILQLNTIPRLPIHVFAMLVSFSQVIHLPKASPCIKKHNQSHPQPRRKDGRSSRELAICTPAKTNISY